MTSVDFAPERLRSRREVPSFGTVDEQAVRGIELAVAVDVAREAVERPGRFEQAVAVEIEIQHIQAVARRRVGVAAGTEVELDGMVDGLEHGLRKRVQHGVAENRRRTDHDQIAPEELNTAVVGTRNLIQGGRLDGGQIEEQVEVADKRSAGRAFLDVETRQGEGNRPVKHGLDDAAGVGPGRLIVTSRVAPLNEKLIFLSIRIGEGLTGRVAVMLPLTLAPAGRTPASWTGSVSTLHWDAEDGQPRTPVSVPEASIETVEVVESTVAIQVEGGSRSDTYVAASIARGDVACLVVRHAPEGIITIALVREDRCWIRGGDRGPGSERALIDRDVQLMRDDSRG